MPLRDKQSPVGTTARLSCRVVSKSRFTTKWYKDGLPIRSGGRYDIQSDFASQTLVIRDCRVEDSGEYKCEVKNLDGVSSTVAMLTVQGMSRSFRDIDIHRCKNIISHLQQWLRENQCKDRVRVLLTTERQIYPCSRHVHQLDMCRNVGSFTLSSNVPSKENMLLHLVITCLTSRGKRTNFLHHSITLICHQKQLTIFSHSGVWCMA